MKVLYDLSSILNNLHHKRTLRLIEKHLNPMVTRNNEDTLHVSRLYSSDRFGSQIEKYGTVIVRSAVMYYNPDEPSDHFVFSVDAPGHHGECLFFINEYLKNTSLLKYVEEQGFIDNHGRFLNRELAREVTLNANQIIDFSINRSYLFSEQMWRLTEESDVFRNHYLNSILIKISNKIKDYLWKKRLSSY